MNINKIGTVGRDEKGFYVMLEKSYVEALKGIEGFSHLHVLWWADKLDLEEYRQILTTQKPYKPGPEELGMFATRSPLRPNLICTTLISVADLDLEKGLIRTYYIDAEEGTPVLDIKPYLPCSDRPEVYSVPEWSAMLPDSIEESASYDWESYFNF